MTVPEVRFMASNPELRRKMAGSEVFRQIKEQARMEIDDEELYLVKGDRLGDEEELFIEAVIRGAVGQGELNRRLYEELDEEERQRIRRQFASPV